jgi:hypothetical protein
MYGKTQVRATYGGHKGFFEDTYRQQLKWMRTSEQIHKEATDQFSRLARFELDFDTGHELLYSDGSKAPNKVANERGSKAPNKFPNGLRLTRTRDLVVVNVDMYLDSHNKHLRSLTNLLPRMHALRSLSIDIKLNIPPLDGESGIDCKPLTSCLLGLSRSSLTSLRIEFHLRNTTKEYTSNWIFADDEAVNTVSTSLEREVKANAAPAMRGIDHQWRKWVDEEKFHSYVVNGLAPMVIWRTLGFEVTTPEHWRSGSYNLGN